MAVFVLDKQKRPLMPCSEKRARLLLKRRRAVVVRLHPFKIRLKDRIGGETQPLRLSLDPGSKTTGIALVRDLERIDPDTGEVCREAHVLWLGELTFQTGDRVIAEVPNGKKAGSHVGRVAVRKTGSFNIQTTQGVIQGISHRYCQVLQRADGYDYSFTPTLTEEARQVS
ncbi:RRXRR domain-containing protein [Rhabdochromatium marinum]|uniref:RRXRR domain-containing protein n=1 Tax=Rhabdochromatium marinum TaxID=48729 RepID=UPI001903FF9A|nr:RRXRR domain-containing protein [Rhabdochromatium marinum]MBK1648013.1 hypothetical protein [Rhabdochromatium marinum]